MQVRALCAGDARAVLRILAGKLDVLDQLQVSAAAVAGASEAERRAAEMRAGKAIMQAVLVDNLDAIWAILADLAGLTPEALDAAPMCTPVEIIRQVVEGDDIAGFFASVAALRGAVAARKV